MDESEHGPDRGDPDRGDTSTWVTITCAALGMFALVATYRLTGNEVAFWAAVAVIAALTGWLVLETARSISRARARR